MRSPQTSHSTIGLSCGAGGPFLCTNTIGIRLVPPPMGPSQESADGVIVFRRGAATSASGLDLHPEPRQGVRTDHRPRPVGVAAQQRETDSRTRHCQPTMTRSSSSRRDAQQPSPMTPYRHPLRYQRWWPCWCTTAAHRRSPGLRRQLTDLPPRPPGSADHPQGRPRLHRTPRPPRAPPPAALPRRPHRRAAVPQPRRHRPAGLHHQLRPDPTARPPRRHPGRRPAQPPTAFGTASPPSCSATACPCRTSRTPWATPTPAPPAATTAPGTTWTATPPTWCSTCSPPAASICVVARSMSGAPRWRP